MLSNGMKLLKKKVNNTPSFQLLFFPRAIIDTCFSLHC